MRRLAPSLAALLLLAGAACSVKAEGAACTIEGEDNCPAGQACGFDGKCSEEAVACGAICAAHQCDGATLHRCVQTSAVCASLEAPATCTANQDCNPSAGACDCKANACDASGGAASCDGSGNLVTCAQEQSTSCWYVASSGPCADPGQSCTSGACACPANRCQASAGAPLCEGVNRVTCQHPAGSTCWEELPAAACADGGQTCIGGACACPGAAGTAAGDLCPTLGETRCDTGRLLRCELTAGSAVCARWVEDDCAGAGLLCDSGAGACACPSLGSAPLTLYADATAPRRQGLTVNGAETPAVCRYASLSEAMSVAASGDTVKATGHASAPVVFIEGALTVKAGVTLTTTDAPLTTTHYVIEPAASVGSTAFVSLAPGAALSGFEIRNAGASGTGVTTSCPGASDTAAVGVDTIQVSALGTGASPPRFATGLRHGGNCSLTVTGSTFLGAADGGMVIDGPATATAVTLVGNTIRNNQATTLYTIGATDRLAGGLVFKGSLPGAVSFRGNRLLSNQGDQILAFASGTLDLSAAACETSDVNVVACYSSGVGVAARAASVNMAHTSWQNELPASPTDFVSGGGGQVNGATQACVAFAGACP